MSVIGHRALDINSPKDNILVSELPSYIRETRQATLTADITDVTFEANTVTGDAVYLDADHSIWRRSYDSDDPLFVERKRFHGIAYNESDVKAVRLFGFISFDIWAFPKDRIIYVSSTNIGKLTHIEPSHTKPIIAGYSVHIDALLIDSDLSQVEDIRNELWDARGTYDFLEDRLDGIDDRITDDVIDGRIVPIELEISNGRGGYANLKAHFDHVKGRVILLEHEMQVARSTFSSLGVRLSTMTSRITTAEGNITTLNTLVNTNYNTLNNRITSEVSDLNVRIDGEVDDIYERIVEEREHVDGEVVRLDGRIDDLTVYTEGEVERIDEGLDERITSSEFGSIFNNFSDEIYAYVLSLIEGLDTVTDIWELDGDGNIMNLDGLPEVFQTGTNDCYFVTLPGGALTTRSGHIDLSGVNSTYWELDGVEPGAAIIPKAIP